MAPYDEAVARQNMVVNKLMIECDHGRVENEWDEQFIRSIQQQLKRGIKLSTKQIDKLEELWEKY